MRLIFIIVYVGLLACICSHVSALRVFDECDDTSSCPDGSKCVWRGCDGRKCICQNEKLPSPDSLSCVPGKNLGETCKPGDVCRGQPFSECLDSKCVCLDGYLLSRDKSHCVPRMKGNATGAEYGQACSVNNVVCVFDLVCRMDTCGCRPGYRIATKEEIFAGPFDYRMCVPEGFSIGKPVDVNGPECRKSGTSTPTTTSSSSTTVTTATTTTTTTTTPTTTTTVTTTTTSTPSTPSTKPTTTPTTTPSTTTSSTTSTTTSTSTSTTPTTTTMPSTTTTITSTATPTTSITTTPSTTAKATPPSTTTTSTTKSTTTSAATTTTPSTNPSQSTTIEATTASQFTKSTLNTGTTTTISTLKILSSSLPPSSTTSLEMSTQRSTTTKTPSSTVTTISPSISTGKTITSNKASSTIPHVTITKYRSSSLPSNISTAHQTHMSAPSSSSTSSTTASNLSSSPFSSPFTNSASSSSLNTTATTETITTTLNSTVGLGDPCLHKACPDNSECVLDSCKVARCRCVLGYAESPDQEMCWKLATLGELCGTERICQGSNTICSDRGICECESGFERSDSGRWCRLKSSWFIDFPVIGEECTGSFSSDCYMYFEQECVKGKCRCKEGFREVKTITDQNAVYPDTVQCRNASYDAGEREAMLCSNQSKERRNHDVYDRAKSKIHKIQGAIIGGSVGFVAFLGIVIGILVLIRFKRKGRQRSIKDTSSTASTDATSRYSFKIPRPFAHFVGSKEFDSTHIAYPNTIFDKDEREEPTATNNEPKPDVVNVGTLLRQNQNQT